MSRPGGPISAVQFVLVQQGPETAIRMSPDVHHAFRGACEGNDAMSVKRRVQFDRAFERFCAGHRLGEERFKKEGNFSDGRGGSVAVWAFKSWQCRLYGSFLRVDNRRCFVGVRFDPAKKQDKADQQMMRAAALDISNLSEYLIRG